MDKKTRVTRRGATLRGGTLRGPRTRQNDPNQPGRPWFVGRRTQLEALYGAVAGAASGGTLRLVNLVGPAGLGKTRLGAELVSILGGGDNPVRIAWLDMADTSSPPIIAQLLRARFDIYPGECLTPRDELDRLALGLADIVPPSRVDDATRLLASLLGLTVDEMGEAIPGFDRETIRTPEFRTRATGTALNLLRYDVSTVPHLFVFDDWDRAARPGDLRMAEMMLQLMAGSQLAAVVVSERALEPAIDVPEPATTEVIELGPLDDAEMRHLVSGLLENVKGLPDHVVDETVGRAGGSPSMCEELVRLLVHREVVRPVTRGARTKWVYEKDNDTHRSMPLPRDVGESVRERLEGFADADRAILEAAAVVGPVFWPRALTSMMRALDPDDTPLHVDADPLGMRIGGAIMSLVERGVLEQMEEDGVLRGHAAMVFGSSAMRDTAYEGIQPERKAELHRLAAQWLVATTPVERLPWLELRAGQLEAGGLGREAARAYLEAGDLARRTNRPAKAAELYRRGLSLVGADAARVAAALLDRLARTYIETSDYEEAECCLREELRFATILDDQARSGHAHVRLGEVLRDLGQFDRAGQHIEGALQLFSETDAGGRADALESLAMLVCQQGEKGAFSTAIKHLEEALELRTQQGDPIEKARTLTVMANVRYSTGAIEEAIRMHSDALRLRERHDDKRGQLLSLNGLGVARYDNGQHDEAVGMWERALRLAEELGDRTQHTIILMNLSEAQLEAGRLDEAELALAQALATAGELGLQRLQGLALCLRSQLHLSRGEEAVATEFAEQALNHGYAIESKEVLGHALLARARALSNALFIDDAGDDTRMKNASEAYQKAIHLLEEMGERPTLVRALDGYGNFLIERGVKNKGRKALRRAEKLRDEMRSAEQRQQAFHEARTIRRTYETGPMHTRDLELVLDMVRGKP